MFNIKEAIIFENKHIIILAKPPGILSQRDKKNAKSLVEYIEDYLLESGQRKKTPFVGLIHRLDRNVGGIMVYGKTKEGTANINKQIQEGLFNKKYLAIVRGCANKEETILSNYLLKNGRSNTSIVVDSSKKNSKLAKMSYKSLDQIVTSEETLSLIEINLFTGRHHQIRVQLSNINLPILGDLKYNNKNIINKNFNSKNLCLWSYYISFKLPFSNERKEFTSKPKTETFNQIFNKFFS